MVWYGVVWCGMVWYVVWCDPLKILRILVERAERAPEFKLGGVQMAIVVAKGNRQTTPHHIYIYIYIVVCCGMVWYGVVWCGLVWFGWCGVVWGGLVGWFGVVWCGLAGWFCVVLCSLLYDCV